ncbi:hypothetical protein C9J03_19885 [Photobacterium gaetbulicola]|uniref:Uncharacterized protein n=1 Tax=Photobacterium gaetbulicola Gung47 TaxID=658445 RepID=A0A0C5WKA1_9GAMM|nr:hypothetical protein [Photobacterium gaetbulicola]AJR07598.1 hypothetical protein H744_2c0887 [Photobacterium gaetbulicola Gung47]PSU03808.1 hypothetical protein C9J03_19885 [Photobacterium gaetbulicola]
MAFFFERAETDNEVKIVLKPHSLYVMLLMLATWLINEMVLHIMPVTQIIMPVFIVFMVIRFFSLVKVQKEVLIAMKQGKVQTSGSKFSFSNPFTYSINK